MHTKKLLLLVLLLALLLRSYPIFIGSMTGPDPWFHARMSEMVVEGQTAPSYDPLSMQGRSYSYVPLFHVLLASFSIFSSIPVISITPLLPAIYGAVAVLLAFAFARRAFKSDSIALFAALAISLMPLHLIRSAAYARPDTLALLLVPTIIFLIYLNRFLPAALLTIALVLLHPLSSLYLFSFIIVWMIVARFKRIDFRFSRAFSIILLGVLVWLLWLYSLPYSPAEYVSGVSFESSENSKPLILNFFTFFTFSWLFLVVAFTKLDAKKHLFLLAWFLFSLLYGMFSSRLAIFLTIPFAVISAYGFGFVFEKTRKVVIGFFFLLFVLALLVVTNEAVSTGWFVKFPERDAMSWLQNTPENSVIACQWDRGHPITYLARRPVVMDGYFEFAPGLDERNRSLQTMAYSSDCNKLFTEKEKWGADYFFVHYSALDSVTFKTGLLEADCNFISVVFSSDYARVLAFS